MWKLLSFLYILMVSPPPTGDRGLNVPNPTSSSGAPFWGVHLLLYGAPSPATLRLHHRTQCVWGLTSTRNMWASGTALTSWWPADRWGAAPWPSGRPSPRAAGATLPGHLVVLWTNNTRPGTMVKLAGGGLRGSLAQLCINSGPALRTSARRCPGIGPVTARCWAVHLIYRRCLVRISQPGTGPVTISHFMTPAVFQRSQCRA